MHESLPSSADSLTVCQELHAMAEQLHGGLTSPSTMQNVGWCKALHHCMSTGAMETGSVTNQSSLSGSLNVSGFAKRQEKVTSLTAPCWPESLVDNAIGLFLRGVGLEPLSPTETKP